MFQKVALKIEIRKKYYYTINNKTIPPPNPSIEYKYGIYYKIKIFNSLPNLNNIRGFRNL